MRDPGSPGRNPLFAPVGDRVSDPISDRVGVPGSTVGALLSAMQEAGPEATEHLLNAAHELVLAIRVVVDAAERALEQQRAAAVPAADAAGAATSGPARPGAAPAEREGRARVTRINLA